MFPGTWIGVRVPAARNLPCRCRFHDSDIGVRQTGMPRTESAEYLEASDTKPLRSSTLDVSDTGAFAARGQRCGRAIRCARYIANPVMAPAFWEMRNHADVGRNVQACRDDCWRVPVPGSCEREQI